MKRAPIWRLTLMLIFVTFEVSLALASDFYQDPNGLYSFVPPQRWIKKAVPDPRSKVEYFDPAEAANNVRVIAGAMEKSSIAEFRARRDRLQRAFPGAIVTTKEINLSGEPAVKHSVVMAKVSAQDIIMFWKGGYEYSISFGAKDNAGLQRLTPIFDAVLASFKIGEGKLVNEVEIHKSQCASWLRLVELFRRLGNEKNAAYYAKLASSSKCDERQ